MDNRAVCFWKRREVSSSSSNSFLIGEGEWARFGWVGVGCLYSRLNAAEWGGGGLAGWEWNLLAGGRGVLPLRSPLSSLRTES